MIARPPRSTRTDTLFPYTTLFRSLAYGADWPVGSANPLEGIEVAITRRTAGDPNGRPLLPNEGVSLKEAIASHTINVAIVNGFDKITGSFAASKSAKLVLLARKILDLPVTPISGTKGLPNL